MIESSTINKWQTQEIDNSGNERGSSSLIVGIVGIDNPPSCSKVESNYHKSQVDEQQLPDNVLGHIAKNLPVSEQRDSVLYPWLPETYRDFLDCAITFKLAPVTVDYLSELYLKVPKEYKTYAMDVTSEYVIKHIKYTKLFFKFYDDLSNNKKLPAFLIERLQMELVSSIGNLPKDGRGKALRHIVMFTSCTPGILNELAKTLNDEFYEFPYQCLTCVTRKMEEFAKNSIDVSDIIQSIKNYIETISPDMMYVCYRPQIVSPFCQELLSLR
ncbi:MAG: hypothetical protein QM578_23115 [Pantoea sp.]|uniref:hypothetical protein n=1 Tax=Pantoea sp. TaxID=69393 RepID=UPI0039E65657